MPLPKLNLRDLFWLVVVVALGLGWWREHHSATSRNQAAMAHSDRRAKFLEEALNNNGMLFKEYPEGFSVYPMPKGASRPSSMRPEPQRGP
jgi:hypothetical protein